MQKKQVGFGILPIIIIILIISLIGFTRFRAVNESSSDDGTVQQENDKLFGIDSASNNQEEVATKSQPKACELVNAAEASELMGEPAKVQEGYDPSDGSAEEDVWVSLCVYQAVNATAEKAGGLVIMVVEGLSDSARTENDAYYAALKAQGNGVDVPGLGDQAFTVSSSTVGVDDIFAKKGNIWISTSAGFGTADANSIQTVSEPEQNKQMLELILNKL